MRNQDVINKFVAGVQNLKGTKNLHIEDGKLVNYYTVLAQWEDGEIVVNSTKYSQSTSVIQGKLRATAGSYREVEGQPMGVRSLV